MTSQWNKKVLANDYVHPIANPFPTGERHVSLQSLEWSVELQWLCYEINCSRAWFVVYTVHACVVPRLCAKWSWGAIKWTRNTCLVFLVNNAPIPDGRGRVSPPCTSMPLLCYRFLFMHGTDNTLTHITDSNSHTSLSLSFCLIEFSVIIIYLGTHPFLCLRPASQL